MAKPAKRVAAAAGLGAVIAGAVALALPGTERSEGQVTRAYRDIGGVWTICAGHTRGVRPGMVATPAQCATMARADLAEHVAAAVQSTPMLAEQPAALAQAGDFSLNAGDGWWLRSPMRRAFLQRRWRAGCLAFRGYVTLYRASRPPRGADCRRNARGVLYCRAAGLVARREREVAACLAGLR